MNESSSDTSENETRSKNKQELNEVKKKKIFTVREKRSRKRSIHPTEWKRKKAALAREHGESYISQKDVLVKAKSINEGVLCTKNCHYRCSEKFNIEAREKIFNSFYKLDINSKILFYLDQLFYQMLGEFEKMQKNIRQQLINIL